MTKTLKQQLGRFRDFRIVVPNALIIVSVMFHGIVVGLIAWNNYPWLTGDSQRYVRLARSILVGEGFGAWTTNAFEPESMRSIGYPVLISIGLLFTGESLVGTIVIQLVLYVASMYLVWRTGNYLFGRTVAAIFLLVLSFYPFIAFSVSQISPEIASLFVISLASFLLLEPTDLRLAASSSSLAIASQFRPNMILIGLVLMVSLVIMREKVAWRLTLVTCSLFVTLLPFGAFNFYQHGKFTPLPITGGLGHSLMLASWMSKVPIDSLIGYGMRGEVDKEIIDSGMSAQISEVNRSVGVPEDTIFVTVESYPDTATRIRVNEVLEERAIENIRADPVGYATTVASNGIRMWFTTKMPSGFPWPLRYALVALGASVAIIGFVGVLFVVASPKEWNLCNLFMIGTFGYLIVTLAPLHTEARYTIPVRLFLLLFCAVGIVKLSDHFRRYSIFKADNRMETSPSIY